MIERLHGASDVRIERCYANGYVLGETKFLDR